MGENGSMEGKKKRDGEKNLRELNSQDGGRRDSSKVRDILIEGAIIGITRKLALDPRIHKNDPR